MPTVCHDCGAEISKEPPYPKFEYNYCDFCKEVIRIMNRILRGYRE